MLQIVVNRTKFVLSYCYLKGFRFKEGAGIDIHGERVENPKSINSRKICPGDDNYAQLYARGHCVARAKT
jgi:hypothetical protein